MRRSRGRSRGHVLSSATIPFGRLTKQEIESTFSTYEWFMMIIKRLLRNKRRKKMGKHIDNGAQRDPQLHNIYYVYHVIGKISIVTWCAPNTRLVVQLVTMKGRIINDFFLRFVSLSTSSSSSTNILHRSVCFYYFSAANHMHRYFTTAWRCVTFGCFAFYRGTCCGVLMRQSLAGKKFLWCLCMETFKSRKNIFLL